MPLVKWMSKQSPHWVVLKCVCAHNSSNSADNLQPVVLAGQDYYCQCRVVKQSSVTFKSVLMRRMVLFVFMCLFVSVCWEFFFLQGFEKNVPNVSGLYTC